MREINEELQRWLDGELGDADLSPDSREAAERWRRVLSAASADVGPAPSWLQHAVMRELPPRRPSRFARAVEWLAQPQTLRIRPLSAGALAAAALAAVLVWPGSESQVEPGPRAASSVQAVDVETDDGRVYVQFVYIAPRASSVTVAGDFNDWSPAEFSLRDPDGDGVWSGRLPLSPGLHKYMYVVDGEWVTDPSAERYVDDGFGNRNALITVTRPGSEI